MDNEREDKAGSMFPEEVEIVLKGKPLPYVSRGGLKLEKAMKNFDLTLDGKVCMDVGASTGGFTDCMLQNGAVKVYSVDVGHGQLDWKLRNDPRVVCMERTNIRYVVPEDIEERPSFVSFISLTKVLLPVRNLMLLIFTIRVSRLAFLITIRSPVFIGTRVSPSKYAMPCSMPPSLEGPSSTSITP